MESSQQSTGSGTALTASPGAVVSDTRRALATAADSVRGRTGNLQAQLADALDSGASVLRQQAAKRAPTESDAGSDSARVAGASGGRVLEKALPRIAAQGELAAGVMERGAIWLRENDLSDLEGRVLGQLEQHPVRTLGIAAALGFLAAGRRR